MSKQLKLKKKPMKLMTNKRYLLVTISGLALPVRVIGDIPNSAGKYILCKTTR